MLSTWTQGPNVLGRRAFRQTIKMPQPQHIRKACLHTERISVTVSIFLIEAYVTHSLPPRAFAVVLCTIFRITLVGWNYQWPLACIFCLHPRPSAVSGHSPASSDRFLTYRARILQVHSWYQCEIDDVRTVGSRANERGGCGWRRASKRDWRTDTMAHWRSDTLAHW